MSTMVKKERNIGLDILRILSMFLITARHYIGYSDVTGLLGFSVNGILATVLSFAVLIGYNLLSSKFPFLKSFDFNTDDSIFSLILSVALFVIFLNIKINNKTVNNIIVALATSSFGVYLIQENCNEGEEK